MRDEPTVGTRTRIAGTITTDLLFRVLMVMGEGIFEDLVKFTIFALACAAIWFGSAPRPA